MPTAALVIIGNEILTGKVEDLNTPFLTRRLYALGVEVRRVQIVPDILEEVGRAVAEASRMFDLVITTGGVGPTHDDVTLAGIAHGLGVELEPLAELEALAREYFKVDVLNEVQARMTRMPSGTRLVYPEGTRFPQIVVGNVYVFPGIPELLQRKFELVCETFRGEPFFLEEIELVAEEADIALILEQALARYPQVQLGSYPLPHGRVRLTLEGRSEDDVRAAFEFLSNKLAGLMPAV